MTSTKHGRTQLICGTGGALLIVSLFLPWAGRAAVDVSGWELWTMAGGGPSIARLNREA